MAAPYRACAGSARLLMAAPYRLMFRAIALTLRAGLRGLRPPLDGCALLLDVSRYRAHASRGLARAPPAVCAASEASRYFLTGAATPPLGGGVYPVRTALVAAKPR